MSAAIDFLSGALNAPVIITALFFIAIAFSY